MTRFATIAVTCISLFAAMTAGAQDDSPRLEIAALVGYRGGGDFDALAGTDNPNIQPAETYGISLGWYRDAETRYELLYDLQSTDIQDSGVDLDVEHLHLGGALGFPATDALAGYISGGLGATRFHPSTGEDETRFSLSLAMGVDVPIGQHFGMRLEARGYLVAMDGDSEIFCGSGPAGGACLVRAAGDTLFQYAVIGAFGFRF